MSTPASTPPPAGAAPPSSASNLDAAASSADATPKTADVGSPVASCPEAPPKPSPPPPESPRPSAGPTFIEVLVTDKEGKPVTNQKYRMRLPDGSVQEGKLDGRGRIFLSSIPPGVCDVMFFQMLEFGTPDEEIKRSWDWQANNGEGGDVPEMSSRKNKVEPIIPDDSDEEPDEEGSGDSAPEPSETADQGESPHTEE